MRNLIIISLLFAMLSCKTNPEKQGVTHGLSLKVSPANFLVKTTAAPNKTSDTTNIDKEIADQTETVYIVVADTGLDYYALSNEMKNLNHSINKPIDTMDRCYNKTKDLIALPDTSSDEIYAGDYYPRRYPSEFMSLEYMSSYKSGSSKKTIALIAGIYEKKASADSAAKRLMPVQGKAFTIKTSLYMGCIH